MHKLILAALVAALPLVSFAQVTWAPTPASAITLSGSFARTDTPDSNLFLSATADIYNGSAYQIATFSGTDLVNNLSLTFEFHSGNDADNSILFAENFRIGITNGGLDSVVVPANTYHFHFDLPVTASGEISGFDVITSTALADAFTFSFDGSGGFDITQSSEFSMPSMGVSSISAGNFSATAIPEPSTTAVIFALATGVVVALRRRSMSRRPKLV